MVTMNNVNNDRFFYVVHPLDDVQEEKCNAETLGPMAMTRSVKWSLMALARILDRDGPAGALSRTLPGRLVRQLMDTDMDTDSSNRPYGG